MPEGKSLVDIQLAAEYPDPDAYVKDVTAGIARIASAAKEAIDGGARPGDVRRVAEDFRKQAVTSLSSSQDTFGPEQTQAMFKLLQKAVTDMAVQLDKAGIGVDSATKGWIAAIKDAERSAASQMRENSARTQRVPVFDANGRLVQGSPTAERAKALDERASTDAATTRQRKVNAAAEALAVKREFDKRVRVRAATDFGVGSPFYSSVDRNILDIAPRSSIADHRRQVAAQQRSEQDDFQALQVLAPKSSIADHQRQVAAQERARAQAQAEAQRQQDADFQAAQFWAPKSSLADRRRYLQDQERGQAAAARGAGNLGFGGPGTMFQRFQGALRTRQGGDTSNISNLDFKTIGQKAGTELGYAIPGLAIGIGIEELAKSISEAKQAQEAFANLKAQFDALGQGSQLKGFNNDVTKVATSTGLAVSEVAQLGAAMKGVYGDTANAETALAGIANAAVAMGISVGQATQDITAITQAFPELSKQGGGAVASVSDMLLTVQDKTGTRAANLAAAVADAGPTAGLLGLDSNTVMAGLGVAAQRFGGNTQGVGDTFSKMIDGLQNPQTQASFLNVLSQTNPAKFSKIMGESGGQRTTDMIGALGDSNIPSSVRIQLLQSLGLNAQALPSATAVSAAFSDPATQKILNGGPETGRSASGAQERIHTVQGEIERLTQSIVTLGADILNSPIGHALATAIGDLASLTSGLTRLGGPLKDVNNALGGVPAQMVALAAGILAVQKAVAAAQALQAFTGGGKAAAVAGDVAAVTGARAGAAAVGGAAAGGKLFPAFRAAGSKALGFGLGDLSALSMGSLLGRGGGAALKGVGGRLLGGAAGALGGGFTGSLPQVAAVAGSGMLGWEIGKGYMHLANSKGTAGRITRDVGNVLGLEALRSVSSWLGNKAGSTGPDTSKIKLTKGQQDMANNMSGKWSGLAKAVGGKAGDTITFDQSHLKTDADFERLMRDTLAAEATGAGKAYWNTTHGPPKPTANPDGTPLTPGNQQDMLTDVTGLMSAYSAGKASFSSLQAAAQKQVDIAKAAYDNGKGGVAAYEQLAQAQQQLGQINDQHAEMLNQAAQLALGTGQQADQTRIQQDISTLAGLTGDNANSYVSTVAGAYQQQLQTNVGRATSQQQALAIGAAGVTISAADAATLSQSQAGQALLTSATRNADGTYSIGKQAPTPSSQYQAYQEQTSAKTAYAVAQANGDPLAQAKARIGGDQQSLRDLTNAGYKTTDPAFKNAQAQLQSDTLTQTDAGTDVTVSGYQLLQAQVAKNPLAAARAADQSAQAAIAMAHGAAAQNRAEAAKASADTAVQDALNDLANSKIALLQAQAGANGDPILAAQYGLKLAVAKAAQQAQNDAKIGKSTADDTTYQTDMAAVAQAQGQLVNTTVSTTISNIQTYMTLGKETASQAIAQLTALLPTVQGNKQETLQVLSEIRQIQNKAGANMNFDIPQLLTSPTLYTARRVEAAGGGGYQDNRQVSIQINMSPADPSSTNKAVQAVLNAAGAPSRNGSAASTFLIP